jgi:3' terminal RNA ribose 2'-O-methyltransferase Hen1
MFLTLSTTHQPATDLGYLLHKHPGKVQAFELTFGRATVFYPVANDERCTVALSVEVDPVELVRGRSGSLSKAGRIDQYVNDRPYAASSFLCVALSNVFGTALSGICNAKPDLVQKALPIEVVVSALPCRGGEALVRALFEPLGYRVDVETTLLDETHPDWGDALHRRVRLVGEVRLSDLLSHLYVLLPVLDDDKHYWVGDDEVEKLLRHGEGWLAAHPERERITQRYLKHRRVLARAALERLAVVDEDGGDDPDEAAQARDAAEEAVERPLSLNEQRLAAVLEVVRASGARSVVDLGCGEGKFLRLAQRERAFERIVGVDVSHRSLERAAERLDLASLPETQRRRVKLLHGSLAYRDRRLEGFDAAVCIEVIEHLDPHRLDGFVTNVFQLIAAPLVVVTTPNREYNVRFETLPAGRLRHADHRFEWTRAEFRAWAEAAARRGGYTFEIAPIGQLDDEVGSPTQMAVFHKAAPT